MKQIDKTELLFEMLLGTDMNNVNRKIEEVKLSPEYARVCNFIPESASSQLGYDIKQRFDSLDIYGVLSLQRILEVEKEIKELDRRISSFPSLNPYLSNGGEHKFSVKKVGDIAVEISAQGMTLNDFTSFDGVRPDNRKKILKQKLFNWYIEAKKGIANSIDNSKLMLSRIRNSKIKIRSLDFQNTLLVIGTSIMLINLAFNPYIGGYFGQTINPIVSVIETFLVYCSIIATLLSCTLITRYKSFPFKVASKLRKQIINQKNLVEELEEKSYQFEKSVLSSSKSSFKINNQVRSLSILSSDEKISNAELFDYVYSEKEYYIQHKRHILKAHNIVFGVGVVLIMAAIFLLILI